MGAKIRFKDIFLNGCCKNGPVRGKGPRHGIGVVKPCARLEGVSGQVFFRKPRREDSESKFSAP